MDPPDPHGGTGGRDDNGLYRNLFLGVSAQPEDPPYFHQHRDGGHRRRSGRYP